MKTQTETLFQEQRCFWPEPYFIRAVSFFLSIGEHGVTPRQQHCYISYQPPSRALDQHPSSHSRLPPMLDHLVALESDHPEEIPRKPYHLADLEDEHPEEKRDACACARPLRMSAQ